MDHQLYTDTLQVRRVERAYGSWYAAARAVRRSGCGGLIRKVDGAARTAPPPRPPATPIHQVVKGFCAKADGKDKLTALVQVRVHAARSARAAVSGHIHATAPASPGAHLNAPCRPGLSLPPAVCLPVCVGWRAGQP
jgi:hypothetical protein